MPFAIKGQKICVKVRKTCHKCKKRSVVERFS